MILILVSAAPLFYPFSIEPHLHILTMMTNEAAPHSDSRLRIAARKGDLAQVKWLMQELPTFSSLSDCLPSALSDAIRAGHVTTASCLLEHGAKLPSDVMSSALASNGSQDMFQLALDHGWDINGRTTIGNPVFTYVFLATCVI